LIPLLNKTLSPEQVTESHIVHADIYTSGAVLEYRGKATLSAGRNRVLFAGITEKANVSRIRIRFQGGITSCHLLGTETYLTEQPPEILSLREEIMDLESEISALDIQYDAWKASVSGSLLEASAEGLSSYLEKLPEKLKANSARKRFLNAVLNEKRKALQSLKEASPRFGEEQISLLCAEITAESDGVYPFLLTAEDPFTFWKPSYELNVEDTEKPIQARLRASIRQQDDQDWENISLCLFYGSMQREGTQPSLSPLQVSFREPSLTYGSSGSRSNAPVARASLKAAPMAYNAEATADFAPAPVPQAEEVHEMMAQYRLPGTYLVKAREETVIDILEQTLEVTYRYSSVPKLSPKVYLTATLKDPHAYQLLPCRAYVNYQQANVGTVQIPEASADDPFVLSLGSESALVIERKTVSDEHSEAMLKGTQTRRLTYEIELLNRKDRPADVQISDQIPLSTEEKIKVEVLDLSGGSLNGKTGEVIWNVTGLEPGGSCKRKLAYQITYPKNTKLTMKTTPVSPHPRTDLISDTGKICPHCGSFLPANATFCLKCGNPVLG